ncbi:MAG: Rpn family recombination-promoting nuclease/putative transposase [Bacilli bacterium]|nr:Rpn family recombination-promoting nuclease/putative transposase [Bacilli bacterium]
MSKKKMFSFKSDFVFKEVFASNDELSRGALRGLLSAYIHKEVNHMEVIQNEIRTSYLLQKETRMDINVIFNDGEIADIEMQLVNHKEELIPRMIYYMTQLFMSQEMDGKSYDNLHNAYTILIVNFTLFEDEEEYHNFMLRDDDNHTLSELLHIIVIELPKVKEQKVEEMDAMQSWNYFLKNYEIEGKEAIIELIKKKQEGIAMPDEKITQISPEQVARIKKIYDDRWALEEKWRFEKAVEEEAAKSLQQGLEQGKLEGKLEGKQALIHTMLKKMSKEEVASLLDLPLKEIEVILSEDK